MNAVFEVLVSSFYLLISSMGYIAMIRKRIDFIQMIFQFNNNNVYWISYKYVYSKGFFFVQISSFQKHLSYLVVRKSIKPKYY